MKKNSIKLLLLFFGNFLLPNLSYSQEISQEEVSFIIKLTLFQESSGTKHYVANSKTLSDFMSLEFSIDTLEQKGFTDYIFFSINPKFKNPDNVTFEEGPFLVDNCEQYVVAMHTRGRTVYRLQGFAHNDFPSLLFSLKEGGYDDIGSLRKFVRNYYIDGIDLECLFRGFKSFNFDKNTYPCLLDCGDID